MQSLGFAPKKCQNVQTLQSLQHLWTSLNAASSKTQPSVTSTQPVFQPVYKRTKYDGRVAETIPKT